MDTKRPRDEQELWEWAAKQARIPEVPEAIRGNLREEEYVRLILEDDDPEAVTDFQVALHRRLKMWQQLPTPNGGWNGVYPNENRLPLGTGEPAELVGLSDAEQEYALACGAYVATLARTTAEVRSIREMLLGGVPLSEQAAEEWLQSLAARVLSRLDFETHSIPLIGHQATALDHHWNLAGAAPLPAADRLMCTVALQVQWHDQTEGVARSQAIVHRCEEFVFKWYSGGRALETDFTPRSPLEENLIWPGSVHDQLRTAANDLCKLYPWENTDAVWFLLTDVPPPVWLTRVNMSIYGAQGHIYGYPTLTFHPRTPATTLHRLLANVQKRILSGRDNRLPGQRNLVLFRFVLHHRSGTDLPTWESVMDLWNEEFPEWAYSNWRNFARDYHRTWEQVVRPHHDWANLAR